ncbi:MAG: flagellar motor switch protein FliN [Candidatus Zixiibacteriota bacterium]|nr:MAG: flagellar motor switch protein FliN [candidate division Zixibacteria bacterium]
MDEKNGIEMPMNGDASDDAAEEQNVQSEGTPEGKADQNPDVQSAESIPMPDGQGDQPDGEDEAADHGSPDLLSTEEVDSAMQKAAAETFTSSDESPDQKQPAVKQADFQQLSVGSEKHEPRNINLLLDVELPISIELGRTRMHISDILALGPGSIVELDKLVGEPVDLLVNQKKVARGEVVVVEENFGLRITHLVSPEERLKNLQ